MKAKTVGLIATQKHTNTNNSVNICVLNLFALPILLKANL